MNITPFDLDSAVALVESEEDFPVDFDVAWKWVGFSTKGNAKRKLESSPLEAGTDFLSELIKSTGGRQSEKIRLTNDAFKHFAMMANTSKGHQVRQYMIEAEKALRKLVLNPPKTSVAPPNHAEALRGWADEIEKREEVEKKLEAAQPAIEYVQRSVKVEGTFSFEQAAKILHLKTEDGKSIGQNILIQGLEEMGVLMRKGKRPIPLQKHVNEGRFEVKYSIFKTPDGRELSTPSTRVTQKGVYWIRQRLIASGCRPAKPNRELPLSFNN